MSSSIDEATSDQSTDPELQGQAQAEVEEAAAPNHEPTPPSGPVLQGFPIQYPVAVLNHEPTPAAAHQKTWAHQQLLAALGEQELAPRAAESKSVPTREAVLHLKADRIARHRLLQIKNFSRAKRTLFYSMLVVYSLIALSISFSMTIGMMTHASFDILVVGAPFVVFIYAAAMILSKQSLLQPTHLRLSDQGLRLQWKRRFSRLTSPLVNWQHISYVGMSHSNGAWFRDNLVQFHVSGLDIPPEHRTFFAWFSSWDFFWLRKRCRLDIDLDGIAFGEEARKFLQSIVHNLPQERIDPLLIEVLNPSQPESYTELWLTSLTTGSDRLRNDPLAGDTVLRNGRYTIIDQIGAGGQGIAYRARVNRTLEDDDVPCSIAVLKEFILPSHGGQSARQKSLSNIEREAELLKQIAHPSIVHLIDFFVEDERAYLVLEYIEGESLRALVKKEGPLPEESVREISDQLCDILNHLHSQSPPVIHRDFTPENIMISPDGSTKLIDFNVAQQLQSTVTKTVVGKHSYIPPEQFRGQATPQSDIYALGATICFMLTGEDPEPISQSHPQQVNANVSAGLDALVAHATATETADRYPNVQALKKDLAAVLDPA